MSSYKTIGQITSYKPLSRCDSEELAAHQRGVAAHGGVLFARGRDREGKDAARQQVLDLFVPAAWECHLSMLTMPGLEWRFERLLLGHREPGWTSRKPWPMRTKITAIENDRAIYYSAAATMPGMETRDALAQVRLAPPFAEHAVKTKYIKRFYFGNVDDLMAQPTDWRCDAAWLDYTGPMSVERLNLIARFYQASVRRILIVTALKARWNKATSAAITKAGGHSEWLRAHLPGEVLHDLEYNDTSPMAQIAVRHPEEAAPCP